MESPNVRVTYLVIEVHIFVIFEDLMTSMN